MEFTSITEHATLVDPSGQEVRQAVDHRVDPLTGHVTTVNLALGEKARAFVGTADVALLEELEARSRGACPFCSAAEKGTRYAASFAPEGQLRFGGALAMPNLFVKGGHDSVIILDTAAHVVRPSQVTAAALSDGIRAGADLVRRTRAADPALHHHLLGMNFLPPGGSSVPHPHFQLLVRTVPFTGVGRVLEASAAWRARTGGSYWRELVEAERGGPRRLGRTGPVEWLAAFAPTHQREVLGVVEGVGSLPELDDGAVAGLAEGIAKVISFYESMGLHAFTMAFFSSPTPGRGGEFSLHARLCSRPPLRPLYMNYETWFGPLFNGDEVVTEPPEAWAAALRSRW